MERSEYVQIGLFDRIYLSEYEDCGLKYLNWIDCEWIPSNQKIVSANVILEKSITHDDWWVAIKVGNEQR